MAIHARGQALLRASIHVFIKIGVVYGLGIMVMYQRYIKIPL